MTSVKYIGLAVHKESISICVRNSVGKVVVESVRFGENVGIPQLSKANRELTIILTMFYNLVRR